MLKWKASVFKLVYHDLAVFLSIYFILAAIYHFLLLDYELGRELFELVCIYSSRYNIKQKFIILKASLF